MNNTDFTDLASKVRSLNEHQVFKSYNELVKALGLQPCKGSQRDAQKKKIRCYLDFEKNGSGNSIIITKIYDSPKTLERKERSYDCQREFDILLFKLLSNAKNHRYLSTKSTLYADMNCYPSRIKNSVNKDCLRMNGEIYDGKTFSVLNQFIRDICNKKVCDRLIKYSRKGLVKYKNAYRAYLSLDDCRDITIYEGSELFEIIKKIQNEVAVSMGAKNVGEIYNNSKYSVVDYYRKCELRYFKEVTLGKVRPLIEITLGDLNVTFSEREYRDAISTWQNYILDSVEQRLNSSIKSRDEKKEQALNGDNNLWSDDLKELFSKEEYENQKSNGELEFENGTIFSVVNKEIQKIDIKYLSDEEYAEIKEILAAWKKDINSK